jgi:hypothetical protein
MRNGSVRTADLPEVEFRFANYLFVSRDPELGRLLGG